MSIIDLPSELRNLMQAEVHQGSAGLLHTRMAEGIPLAHAFHLRLAVARPSPDKRGGHSAHSPVQCWPYPETSLQAQSDKIRVYAIEVWAHAIHNAASG